MRIKKRSRKWDLVVPVPALFQDCKAEVRIPHTSSVKGCHSCLRLGRSVCVECMASGRRQCGLCSGSGWYFNNQCLACGGTGIAVCISCGGMGSTVCSTCYGKGKLLWFLKLKIKWKNNIHKTVLYKHSELPIDQLEKVIGENLFTEMNQLVYPVVSFPDNAVNAASREAVRAHQAQFSTTCRILQQRQTIELIPVTRVHYSWKEKTHIYFVYGAEHKVYTKDYPVKCCCCSIL
ncbi:protein SSUH2 homolog [Chanos chanos]|uniref:Protein SSUH2 homolog n=1 Tax=Chanos chanos TaxID=29144 RepID=A0A6J2VSF9_CHACN|nr:protein SSUH2 homolog [Chanos chanos]